MAPDTYPNGSAIQRVAIIVAGMSPGGKERVVFHLATGLAARGIEPLVVCLEERGEFGERLAAEGVAVEALGSRWGWDFVAIGRLARLLRGFRPDIINVHDRASLPYAFAANRVSVRAPLVVSCHGLLFQDSSHPRRVERLAMRDVRRVTAVSAQAAREYARLLAWSDPVDIVLNGVPMVPREPDLGRAVRDELGLPPRMFVFLAVGNLIPEKGYEDLLDAAARLKADTPVPFVVLVAGGKDYDSECWEKLSRHAERLALADTVRFLGLRSDVSALHSAADTYILSSHKEGLPMALLEAMAARLPVLATRVGGVPDVVRHAVEGLLVEPSRPDALAGAMSRLLTDPPLRNRLAAAARLTVEATHSVHHMTAQYVTVYEAARRTRVGLRRTLSHALCGSSLPAALRRRRSHVGIILYYHGVIPDRMDRGWLTADMVRESLFQRHLDFLAEHYHVVPLSHIAAAAAGQGPPLPPNACTITFDDGFRNNLQYAVPALKARGMTATFFVTSGFLDGQVHLWWLLVKRCFALAQRDGRPVVIPGLGTFETASPEEAEQSYLKALLLLKRVSAAERTKWLKLLRDLGPGAEDALGGIHDPLSWDEVRRLIAEGMEVGAHTLTHPILSCEPPEMARQEIEESIRRVRDETGRRQIPFAYPNGQPGDFTPDTERATREAGAYAAVAGFAGWVQPGSDLYALRRFPIGGHHNPDALELDLCGFRLAVHRVRSMVSLLKPIGDEA